MACRHHSDDSVVEGIEDVDGGVFWICGECNAFVDYTPPCEFPENLEGVSFEFIPGAGSKDWEH